MKAKPKKKSKSGRKPLSAAEKARREAMLREETKGARFVRLGQARLERALVAIQVIGNLAAPAYHFTPGQIDAIEKALQDGVASAIGRFRDPLGAIGPVVDLATAGEGPT
jgi:hypothetical protein